jgi:hypothetical protein
MTDSKRHLLDIVVYNAVEAMDVKDLREFAQNTLFEFYAQWSEQDLKDYLDKNWPLDN